jgi:hypothetical protein
VHEDVLLARCELPGAFAESKLSLVGVYVPGSTANATETDTAVSNVNKAVKIPSPTSAVRRPTRASFGVAPSVTARGVVHTMAESACSADQVR